MVLHARFALVRFIQVRVRNCVADADITFSIHDDVDDDAGGVGAGMGCWYKHSYLFNILL